MGATNSYGPRREPEVIVMNRDDDSRRSCSRPCMQFRYDIRNVAIIAHGDHGKTTLVDALLKQAGAIRANQQVDERVMDSNDLEKERGITILAKTTSIRYLVDEPDALGHLVHHEATHTASGHDLPAAFIHPSEVKINIVDTPGHADFGGEVERILSMVDGVILLVDAAEGPMPQTKFVTGKALALGLKPIVVINKIDRPDARPAEVLDEMFELFLALEANDEQLDFPTLYASGRAGYAGANDDVRSGDLSPLFHTIVDHVAPPEADLDGPFKMLTTMLDRDNFLGRVLTGRIASGKLTMNMPIKALDADGAVIEEGRATKIIAYRGLERVAVDSAQAGDIVALAGLTRTPVSHSIVEPDVTEALRAQPIDPPTLAITFSVNDSPLAGREGSKVTSRMIRDRLLRDGEGNVAIQVTESADKDSFEVAGRGELQLGVLIETMRR